MIIDSHVHLVTGGMVKSATKRLEKMAPGLFAKAVKSGDGLMNKKFLDFLKSMTIEDFAKLWTREMDANQVDKALFLPIGGAGHDDLDEFTQANPDRFRAYLMPDDPTKKKAVKELEGRAKTGRFVGIKLYPCLSGISVADKKAFPLYEAAGELGMPILVHFGITHAPLADYRLTNPLDLVLPMRLFPETNFIIAHFGAGFFREVLLLGFHAKNLYVDTSGTNNWRLYLPVVRELKDIYRRAVDVFTAEKILFGTDTIMNGATGYRLFVLDEQRAALDALSLPEEDKALIMGGNAKRLFGLG